LVGGAKAAALLPDQAVIRKLLECCCHTLLSHAQFLCHFLAGEDNKDLAELIDPSVYAAELKAIEQQLKYGRLDDQSRAELERKKQDILNEQYDADFERDAEKRKTEIQNEANKQMDKNTSAMNDLSVSLDNFAYAISKASGTLTAQQIVNHNTKNQNIKVIQQAGLSKKQTDAFLAAIFDG
jgi:hypothetical protein